ncbi:MAG: cytidyltransferase [Candidatus Pelagibacter sp.]|nr:cytidyltransferase [Candidatus Pelagibacter sp.]RPG12079.1 MAG: cytidyltransferase [Pelagibacteraceae bacterium TMED170]|tara:strand:- start:1950 stop:2345 length:396 start_codon:yes stop_codon:yes gene_type:complete
MINKKKRKKRIMVDLTCSILHHGHIRLLKKASKIGRVVVALTSDDDIKKVKKFTSPLNFSQRKEILLSIKYVYQVVKSKWSITDSFLKKHNIDFLVHGNDNRNKISTKYLKIFSRTKKISSTLIRSKIYKN